MPSLLATAIGRALVSQLHPTMLGLALLPFIATLVLWLGLGAWLVTDVVRFLNATVFQWAGLQSIDAWATGLASQWGLTWLAHGLIAFAGWMVLLPIIFVFIFALLAVFGTPLIAAHIAKNYPKLAAHHGGNLLGSFGNAAVTLLLFTLSWIIVLPLCFFLAPLSPILWLLPWAWLNARMFRYDALFQLADRAELTQLGRTHWWGFFGLGLLAAFLTFLPVIGLFLFVFIALTFVHYAFLIVELHRNASA